MFEIVYNNRERKYILNIELLMKDENLNDIIELNCSYNQINNLPNNLKYLYYVNNPIYDFINLYFNKDIKNYIEWKNNYLKKYILKIENWFLDCKYNPKYKYCQKFVMSNYNNDYKIDI